MDRRNRNEIKVLPIMGSDLAWRRRWRLRAPASHESEEIAMRVWTAILLSLTSVAAFAGTVPAPLPEPGTLALLAAAGVVGLVLKRRNKK